GITPVIRRSFERTGDSPLPKVTWPWVIPDNWPSSPRRPAWSRPAITSANPRLTGDARTLFTGALGRGRLPATPLASRAKKGLGAPGRRLDQPANREPDGATRGTRARTGGRFRRKPGPVGRGDRRFRSPNFVC